MSEVHLNGSIVNWGYYQNQDKKAENKETKETKTNLNPDLKQADPNNVLDALSAIGKQNVAFISVNTQEVDPAKYLSEERIASIEDSMKIFEQGVSIYADALKKEFGRGVSETTINALAAQAFAGEA